MATKTLYLKNVTTNGALSLQDGGTAPTAAITATGWTVAKVGASNFSLMAVGSKRASTTFGADALTTPAFSAGSCWRSENPFSGNFANTNWTLTFRLRAVSAASAQTGRVKVRMWKSAAADGTGATQITSGILTGTTTAALSTSASQSSTVTWSPGAITSFANEYLWVQCEWEIVVASGSNNGDSVFYIESTAAITTPDFTVPVPNYAQVNYRWRSDGNAIDGTPTWDSKEDGVVTAWTATNTNPAYNAGRNERLRFTIQNTGDVGSLGELWTINYSKNGGAYTPVPTTSGAGVKAQDFIGLVDNAALTVQRLSSGAGAWVNGQNDLNGVTSSLQIDGGKFTEIEYSLIFTSSEVADLDRYDFRLYRGTTALNTYSVTPQIFASRFGIANSYLSLADPTTYQLTEDATASAVHRAHNFFTADIGKRYWFSLEFKPVGPTPRGLEFGIYGATGYCLQYVSNTGTDLGAAAGGTATLDAHAVTDVGGGWFKIEVQGTLGESTASCINGLYLFNTAASSSSYTGADDGSGVQFRNYYFLEIATCTLAVTEATDGVLFNGRVGTEGTLAVTEALDTALFNGSVTWPAITGTLAVTDAKDTVAITGGPVLSAVLAVTETPDDPTFTGGPVLAAQLAVIEATDSALFNGSVTWPAITGTLAVTEAIDVASFTVILVTAGEITGVLATTEAKDTASFAGSLGPTPIFATLAVTEAIDAVAFVGGPVLSGVFATTEAKDTVAFAGAIFNAITGTLATTEAIDVAAFTGTVLTLSPIIGYLATTERPDTVRFGVLTYAVPGPLNFGIPRVIIPRRI